MAAPQLETEDWILFLSTVFGSAAMLPTNDPRYMLYGLTVGTISKSLLSLGPNLRSWEDWALFGGSFLGTFGAMLSSNFFRHQVDIR